MTRTPANPRCDRCRPKRPCLNCISTWQQGEWLGRHLWAINRETENVKLNWKPQ